MQDMYTNLPGQMVQFKDGGLQLRNDPNPPLTGSVLLLGTAVDGPLLEPVAIDNTTAELVFGKGTRPNGLPNGSTLIKGFDQAYAAGCRDIRLMRATGAYATGSISATSVTSTQDVPKDDLLGPASGNDAVVFNLNNAGIIAATVVVTANGVKLPSGSYTVVPGVQGATPVDGSVSLNANVTDSNASVYISYSYTDMGANTINTSQNGFTDTGGALHRYVATAAVKTIALSAVVKPGSLVLYASGVTVDSAGYALGADGKSVMLQPGYVAYGANLEATYFNTATVIKAPSVGVQSVFAGSLYNDVNYDVKDITENSIVVGKLVEFFKPDSKKAQIAEAPLSYSSIDYPSFGLLVNAVNGDPNNNVVTLSVDNQDINADTSTLLSIPITYLVGGDDGLNPDAETMYQALGGVRDASGNLTQVGAYQLLENYSVDQVVPVGVYADTPLANKYDDFAYQLALACAVMTFRNHMTVGRIAMTSPNDVGLQSVANQVTNAVAYNNNYFMRDAQGNILKDSDGNNIDLGRNISVIEGADIVFNSQRFGVYAENSAAAYAGYTSTLAPEQSPTNQILPFAAGLRYEFSNSQLNTLTGQRYVTFKSKNNGTNVAVTDAMTAAQPGSDYVRETTIQVVKTVVNDIYEVADPFIGQPNETPQQNALAAAISKRLDQRKKDGVIQAYTFQIISTPQMKLLGQAQIELSIIPPQELRQLTTVVSLSPGA
jgi:hypothetical protein